MSRKIGKNSAKMYHIFNKNSKFPWYESGIFLYNLYIFKNLPEMEEKSPWFLFQTHHMYEFSADDGGRKLWYF